MGSMELPDIGFKADFGRQFSAILAEGLAEMVSRKDDATEFENAYIQMDLRLLQLVQAHGPPIRIVEEMVAWEHKMVEATVKAYGVKLPVRENVKRTCALILNALEDHMVHLNRLPGDTVGALVNKGGFTPIDAKRLVAVLSSLGCNGLRDMVETVGRSRDIRYRRFLEFLEQNGTAGAQKLARKAKEELLSTVSVPKAKIVPMQRPVPRPLRRIRQ